MFDRNSDVSRIRSPWDACESWSADINPWEQDWWCQRPLCVCLGVSLLQHAHTHTHKHHISTCRDTWETRPPHSLACMHTFAHSNANTHLTRKSSSPILPLWKSRPQTWHAMIREDLRTDVTSQRRRPITSRPEQDFILHIKTKYPTVSWNQTDEAVLFIRRDSRLYKDGRQKRRTRVR